MKKTISIILITILLGFVSSFSYWLGYGQGAIKAPAFDLVKSKAIQRLSAQISGELVEITDRTIAVKADEDILSILISEETKFSIIKESKTMKTESAELKDLKIGDQVSVSAELEGENFVGKSIIVFP